MADGADEIRFDVGAGKEFLVHARIVAIAIAGVNLLAAFNIASWSGASGIPP